MKRGGISSLGGSTDDGEVDGDDKDMEGDEGERGVLPGEARNRWGSVYCRRAV